MPTILLKKSDTPGSVPGTANLTNLAGGVEVAVNTADKRVYSMTSASAVIELGTNPSSLTCSDVSATVLRAGSATITNLLATTLTVSGGTANGVLYLNGSKVATSGSALTFDGTNLALTTANSIYRVPTAGGFLFDAGGNNGIYILGSSNYVATYTGGTERMRLTSSVLSTDSSINVGIGTASPLNKLDVRAASDVIANYQTIQAFSTDSAAIDKGAGLALGGYYSGTSSIAMFGSLVGRKENSTAGNFSGYLAFGTNNNATGVTEKMRLDSSGNLGLGVTPSAWAGKAFQIGNASNSGWASIGYDANGKGFFSTSAYNNTGSSWTYTATGFAATLYSADAGSHKWYNAPSGTAGNAISFTQAMTLDASGNLGIGTTSPTFVAGGGIHIENSTASALHLTDISSGSTSTDGAFFAFDNPNLYIQNKENGFMVFETNATERARITSTGQFLMGTTGGSADKMEIQGSETLAIWINLSASDANYKTTMAFTDNVGNIRGTIKVNNAGAQYNTTSDRRLKENISAADDAGSVIDAIQIVKHDWKVGGHVRYGVIAQDLNEVAPEAVAIGEPDDVEELKNPWGVDYSKLVPMLVKEIQSLRSRVAALEAK